MTPTTGLTTNETGYVTQFTVVATCKPTANVHITLASTDDSEGMASLTDVTFTPDNWSLPQVINVSGKGDCAVDGDVNYAIAHALLCIEQ